MKQSRKTTIIELLKHLSDLKWYMVLNCVICLAYELLPIINAFAISYMIGALISGENLRYDLLFVGLAISTILQGVLGYLNMWTEHDIAYKLLYKFRYEIYCRLEKAIPSFESDITSAEIVSISSNDMNLIEWFYAHTVNVFLVSVVTLLFVIVFFFRIHYLFAINALIWLTLYLITPIIFKKKSFEHGKEIRENFGKLSGLVVDFAQGMRDIISFGYGDRFKQRIFKQVELYDRAKTVDGDRRALEWMYTIFVASAMSICSLLISNHLVKTNSISTKWITVVLIVGGSVFTIFNKFIAMSTQFSSIFAAAGRVFELLNIPIQVEDNGTIVFDEKVETIEFRNVSYSYPMSNECQIKNMSFVINNKSRIALSGESGSGKSTIVNLLQRYADVTSGEILVNGKNIKEFTLESWRNALSVVTQNSYLFKGSILENIKMGKMDATDDEIMLASKISQADEFISQLSDGYNTQIGERALKLSGGQKQRLSIARAILKESSFLIFDEVQSDLDTENEEKLNEALKKYAEDKMLISIAHRVSSIVSSDMVLFIDGGELKGYDTFENLRENSELFRKKVLGEK